MLGGSLNLVPAAVGQRRPQLLYATVSTTQPLPVSHTQPLYVVEPHAPDYFTVVSGGFWMVGHGATVPTAGQPVLLFRDNYQNLWCIAP